LLRIDVLEPFLGHFWGEKITIGKQGNSFPCFPICSNSCFPVSLAKSKMQKSTNRETGKQKFKTLPTVKKQSVFMWFRARSRSITSWDNEESLFMAHKLWAMKRSRAKSFSSDIIFEKDDHNLFNWV
jgi:hypothetical protein